MTQNRGGSPAWHYYYLYGLERIGSLSGQAKLGEFDWYRTGAEYLLKQQQPDGSWRTAGQTTATWPPTPMIGANTCFAMLFLKRATTVSGSFSKGDDAFVMEDEDSPVWLRITGRDTQTMWVSGFGPGLVDLHSDPEAPVSGLRVIEVRYLLNGEVLETVAGDPQKGWDGERFASQATVPRGGDHEFVVEVDVVSPHGTDAEGQVTLGSLPLTVRAEGTYEPWMQAFATASESNLFLGAEFKVESTSQFSGRWSPKDAFDGHQFSGWMCAAGDEQPSFTIEFDKPVRANTLLLSTLTHTEANRGNYARPTRLELKVNKSGKPIHIELNGDPQAKTEVDLGRAIGIRRLIVTILATAAGPADRTTGLAEIEALKR